MSINTTNSDNYMTNSWNMNLSSRLRDRLRFRRASSTSDPGPGEVLVDG